MLTKTDFSQLKKIIREEVQFESRKTREELITEVKLTRMDISNQIANLEDRTKNLEMNTSVLKKETNRIQKQLQSIQKDISVIISSFDRENIRLKKRVTRIESHLGIPHD